MRAPLDEIAKHKPRPLRPLELFADRKRKCVQTVLVSYMEDEPAESHSFMNNSTKHLGSEVAPQGYMCGALLGAVMVLSCKTAVTQVSEKECEERIDAFMQKFSQENDAPFCRGIKGWYAGTLRTYEACRILEVNTIESVVTALADLKKATNPDFRETRSDYCE